MEATCLGHAAFPHLVGEEGKCGGLTGTRRGCGTAVVQAVREDRSREFFVGVFNAVDFGDWRGGVGSGERGAESGEWRTEWVIE